MGFTFAIGTSVVWADCRGWSGVVGVASSEWWGANVCSSDRSWSRRRRQRAAGAAVEDWRRRSPGPSAEGSHAMAESVYKIIELVGTSTESWEKAAAAAVAL